MIKLSDFEPMQPLATRYLSKALETGQLVNAYIFRGMDFAVMYRMALCLAQIVNCRQAPGPTTACGQCQPCRWISENAHPGIMTISNLTCLADADPETGRSKSGKAQQSISVAQLDLLLHSLGLHSGGFRRMVILCGAQEVFRQADPEQPMPASGIIPPKDWQASENMQLQWLPLDRRIFPERLANKFLKTLEEPPPDTLFCLLTDSEDKLLDTIVSRCQLLPFRTPASLRRPEVMPVLDGLFEQLLYPPPGHDFLARTRTFLDFMSAQQVPSDEGLSRFQQYVRDQMLSGCLDEPGFIRYKQLVTALEQARRMIRDKTREEAVLENLFYAMT